MAEAETPREVRGKMTIVFNAKHADVAQRAADMLACGPIRASDSGVVVLQCTVRRFERLLDEVAS